MCRSDLNYWLQFLPGLLAVGLGMAITVAPLTAAVLGAVDPARAGIGSAVNNAVSRIAGLVAIASLGVIVGTQLDVEGYHRAAVATAVFLIVGACVSWIGIRNPAPTPGDTGATPPPAAAPSTGSTHIPPHVAERARARRRQLAAARSCAGATIPPISAATSSAAIRSAVRSSTCSRPIDNRTIPAPGFAGPATGRWVSDAGCCTSESTPPSETACVTSSHDSVNRAAAS